MSEVGQKQKFGGSVQTSVMVGKRTFAFMDSEIVPGYVPKFWRSEITSAYTPEGDIAVAAFRWMSSVHRRRTHQPVTKGCTLK